jgi:hypothetical protein
VGMMVIHIDWFESNDRIDAMFKWCSLEFGKKNYKAQLSEINRWEVQSFAVPPTRFKIRFYSDNDATLFKLRWLDDNN